MFIGINTNIQHKGKTYHVQTEDGGLDQHTLTTILFINGVILSARKSHYLDIPKSDGFDETIKGMMQQQHKQMLRDLVSGKLDLKNADIQDQKPVLDEKPVVDSVAQKPETFVSCEENIHMNWKGSKVQKKGLDALIFEFLAKKEAAEHL